MTLRTPEDVLLGLDIGTSSVKAGLFSVDGAPLDRERVTLRVRSPRPGYLEIDAEEVWTAVVTAARSLLGRTAGPRVAAVGLAAASPTPMLVDRSGRPVSPVCTFADARAAGDLDAFAARLPYGTFERLTGNPLALPTCSALTAKHLTRAVEQSSRAGGLRFGHLATFLVHRLTGRWVMDPTNAAYTGLLRLAEPDGWSADAIAALDVDRELLPELVPSVQAVGRTTREATEQLGLAAPALVTSGVADTASAAFAVRCLDDGDAFESIGTSGVLTVCRDEPISAPHAMNRPHVVPRRWLSHAAISSGGAAVAWLSERVLNGATEGRDLVAMNQLAASAPAGCGGVVFLPYLAGERSPVWDPAARGAWVGMTLDTSAAHLARAVFEGTAYGLRQLIELETALSGNALRELLTVGGGTNSAFWTSVKADVTGRVFHRATEGDVAMRGAALLGATAAGLYDTPLDAAQAGAAIATTRVDPSDDPTTRRVYDEMYAVYERVYPALRPLFPALRNAVAAYEDDDKPEPVRNVRITERNTHVGTA